MGWEAWWWVGGIVGRAAEAREAAADLLVLQALRHGHIGLALELLLALVQVVEVGLAALSVSHVEDIFA